MTDKNMADVADKAVDKLAAVAEAIGRMAPGVWESAVRSERVEGIVNVALLLGLCVMAVFALRKFSSELAAWKVLERKPYDDFPLMPPVWGLVALTASVVAIGMNCDNLANEVARVVSPDYYAAHSLLSVVK